MNSNKDIRKQLGEKIREFRLALGISPKDFGDDIGEDVYYVLQLEEGQLDPGIETLARCASALGLGVSELFDAAQMDSAPLVLVEAESHGEAETSIDSTVTAY